MAQDDTYVIKQKSGTHWQLIEGGEGLAIIG